MNGTVLVPITADDLLELTQDFMVTTVLGPNADNTIFISASNNLTVDIIDMDGDCE